MTDNEKCQPEPQITSIADAVVKLKELRESNKNLNEPDIEERFARLSLAFKTDKFTLGKRLDLHKRQRDVAEKNIETELQCLRESLNALNQLCTESEMREIITKTHKHVDIVQRATLRMSNRAETYGAIQQEERLNCAFETMLNYVEHLKLLYDKEHLELEEYRRLLAEHNLLPGEKADGDDPRRTVLQPRSHSLSSSSKPEFLRRISLAAFIRSPHSDSSHRVVSRENSVGHLSSTGLNANVLRQKLESRTRLLSSVCLLNNNYDSLRISQNGTSSSASPGSISPKSRRSSLPAGPTSSYGHSSNTSTPLRTHNSIHETSEPKKERRESQTKSSTESGLLETVVDSVKEEVAGPNALEEQPTQETPDAKDSSELNFCRLSVPDLASNTASCSLQESACDNSGMEDVCLLPEISIPIKPKPMYYFLNLMRKCTSLQRIWRWDSARTLDSATLILHARYALSVTLATAAMLTFVLTFVPNSSISL